MALFAEKPHFAVAVASSILHIQAEDSFRNRDFRMADIDRSQCALPHGRRPARCGNVPQMTMHRDGPLSATTDRWRGMGRLRVIAHD
jgi:hypothetical protein